MESKPLLYNHGNGLSASVLPTSNPQVSSVGFNTLKKWNTGSSQQLGVSSLNTVTTNSKGLSRFFTRNKSGMNIGGDVSTPTSNRDNDDIGTINSLDPIKSTPSMFKFTKLKMSKGGNGKNSNDIHRSSLDHGPIGSESPNLVRRSLSGSKKPELKIQTHGHHGLKVPKKILSSKTDDGRISHRKSSVSSPVSTFQNLFSRSNHANSLESTISGSNSTLLIDDAQRNGMGLGIESDNINGSKGVLAGEGSISSNSSGIGANNNGPVLKSSSGSNDLDDHHIRLHIRNQLFLGINNPNRTTVDLSSNNSNSTISDVPFAMLYNFTDPDYSVNLFDNNTNQSNIVMADEHSTPATTTSTIKENFQKKLLIPTDQYLQSKLGRNMTPTSATNVSFELSNAGVPIYNNGEANANLGKFPGIDLNGSTNGNGFDSNLQGLCINTDDFTSRYLLEFSNKNFQFFTLLLGVVRPVFVPSQQRKLANGYYHAYIGMTLEDISNYVQENYVKQIGQGTGGTNGGGILSGLGIGGFGGGRVGEDLYGVSAASPLNISKKKFKSSRGGTISGAPSTTNMSNLDTRKIDDVSIREVYQDLLTFSMKCMLVYNEDYGKVKGSSSGVAGGYKKNWEKIIKQWEYFNQRIKFQVVTVFYPLEKFFGNFLAVQYPTISIRIVIENIISLAFRDAIIIPFLMERSSAYGKQYGEVTVASSKEVSLLKEDNNALLRKVIECFGVIFTKTSSEMGNADGEEHIRSQMFRQTFEWLTGII